MAPIHIPNAPVASVTFGPNEGFVFYAGLDGSIRQLTLSGPSFATPTEKAISDAGVVKQGSPFAALTIGQSLRVYYVNKYGFLSERGQGRLSQWQHAREKLERVMAVTPLYANSMTADGGDWYDRSLNQLQRKVDDNLQWLYAK